MHEITWSASDTGSGIDAISLDYTTEPLDSWDEMEKFELSSPEAGAKFGKAVARSGENLLVSAFREDFNGAETGAVYHYQWN